MQNNLSGKDAYEAQKAEKLKVKTFTNKQKINRIFRWMLVGALLLATFYGLYWLLSQPKVSGDPTVVAQIKENDIVLGNPDAPVKLVEYSDFQCPACQSYFPIVKEALVQVGSDVAFIYRHYPLPQHRNASLAALAAEAAGRQGAFWEMHDMLFINQADWSDLSATEAKDVFISYAMSLDLEPETFFADLSNEEIKSKITSNIAEGKAAGVTGTPSFFINGEKIINPRGVEDLVSLLEEEINSVESKEVVETTEQSN